MSGAPFVSVSVPVEEVVRVWLRNESSSWHWPIRDRAAESAQPPQFHELRVTGMADGFLRFGHSVNGNEVEAVILPWRALFSWHADLTQILGSTREQLEAAKKVLRAELGDDPRRSGSAV